MALCRALWWFWWVLGDAWTPDRKNSSPPKMSTLSPILVAAGTPAKRENGRSGQERAGREAVSRAGTASLKSFMRHCHGWI